MTAEREDRALAWLRERQQAGESDRALAGLLGCNHTTVSRGKPNARREGLTRGLRRYIEAYLDGVNRQAVEQRDDGKAEGEDAAGVAVSEATPDAEAMADATMDGADAATEGDSAAGLAQDADEDVSVSIGDTTGSEEALTDRDEPAPQTDDTEASAPQASAPEGRQGAVAAVVEADEQPVDEGDSEVACGDDAEAPEQPDSVCDDAEQGPDVSASTGVDEAAQPAAEVGGRQVRQNAPPACTSEDIVDEWLNSARDTPRHKQREEYLLRRKRQRQAEGIKEIAAASSVSELVGIWAYGREEPLAALYPVSAEDAAPESDTDTIARFKFHALAALMETPVLQELPWNVALNAAETMARRKVTPLSLPFGFKRRGDAGYLLVSGAPVNYEDAGAKELAFTPGTAILKSGYTAAELRFGVNPDHRMRRYAYPEHKGRPRMIGVRFSDVIPDETYPDEDWFFGSRGWISERSGKWYPSRGEVIARWRHIRSLYEGWNARERANPWHIWLEQAVNELELVLLSDEYAMTFDKYILGKARWPASTRGAFETYSREMRLEANKGRLKRRFLRAGRRRILRKAALWLSGGWLFASIVRRVRRDSAVYIEKENRPKGAERRRELLNALRKWRLYDKSDPNTRLPVLRYGVMPALYGPKGEQGFLTRIVSRLLYRCYSELDGSVCGEKDWPVTDPPMTPEYMTPHPRTGYIPSEAYHKRFRHHEYEIGYQPPAGEPERVGILRGIGGVIRRGASALRLRRGQKAT